MVRVICPRCGKENPSGAKFCLECGSSLVVEGRLAAREERKVVSVLFADLAGFTSQAERLDPEEVRAILQPYHASVREDLERFGGTVEKFIGDAVMALFGAPVAHEDDPERAVRAALAIRDRLVAEGRLHVRIGITTGEALVVLEARPESGEGMASGDVVNTASRLQSAAPVDGILVDEPTYRATARAIDYREHPSIMVKGKAAPISVREAIAARARFGVDVGQAVQSPLVGRIQELDLLSAALERANAQREPQLVTLVGVPGIGKSRLVWELFGRIDAAEEFIIWRQGRSLPYAEGISYWALGEIVKAEAGILETDSGDEAAAKLSRAMSALELEASDAEWIARHLRPLVGLEPAGELRGDRRGEAFAAWRRFLEALAEEHPVVLVFEDLHWADDGLLDFVDNLVDWASGVRMLIVGTSRPELLARRPDWGGGKPNALTISLPPLTEAETARLVADLVERAVMPMSGMDAVVERAQGNPLYAEEFARLAAERGRMDELPESVQGIIAARLDALSRGEKELLQDAAVVGKVFWSGAVAAMTGRGRGEVEASLHGLERREFVRRERRSSVAGETEYAFRHILVPDVAYGQIPRAERAERHVRAAGWIEGLGRPADHAELLAQHYLSAIELARAAGQPTDRYAPQAGAALREAGDRAFGLNSFGSAARYYRAALELMASDDPHRPMALFRCGKALRFSAETGSDLLAEAEAALLEAGDRETAAEAVCVQADLAWDAGDGDLTARHVARAADLVEGLPDSASKAYVLSDISRFHMLAARYAPAIELGGQALAMAEALGLDEIRAHALNNIGSAKSLSGDRGGLTDIETALEIATTINSPEAARASNNLATTLYEFGETERARHVWRDGLRLAEQQGHGPTVRFIRGAMPFLDVMEGNWDRALSEADDFVAEAEAAGGTYQEATLRTDRGHIRLARGDAEGALDDAQRALDAGRRAEDPQALVPALSFMAWVLLQMGRTSEAGTLIGELLQLDVAAADFRFELAVDLVAMGQARDIERLAHRMAATPWRDVLELVAGGRFTDAADRFEELGNLPTAAYVRRRAAEGLLAEGRLAEARDLLNRSLAFWRSVRATRFIVEAESLLVAVDQADRGAQPPVEARGSRMGTNHTT
jgi:class 3 adenylate cyclase/tetratricopeptide (TPR) repeat protein